MAHIITFRGVDEHPYDLIKLLRPDVLVTSETTADVNDEDRRLLRSYCTEEPVVFPPQSSTTTTAKFKRFAEGLGVETADKLRVAINDIFSTFGVSFHIVVNGEHR
jgi:hypothetical protein